MRIYPITGPAGSDTEVQYNNGGIFGADSTFNFNDTTKVVDMDGLTLTGSLTYGLDASAGTWSSAVFNVDHPFHIYANGTRCMYFNDTSAIAVFGMGDAGNIDSITSGSQISAFGSKVFRNVTTGGNLVGIGTLAGAGIVGGTNVVAIGPSSLPNSVTPSNVIAIGGLSLSATVNYLRVIAVGLAAGRFAGSGGSGGYDLTIVGDNAAYGVSGQSTFYETSAFGSKAAYSLTTGGKRGIFLGFKSGYNQTTLNDRLIIDSRDRGSAAAEITDCLVYGVMDATATNQSLRINADLITGNGSEHRFMDVGNSNYVGFQAPALTADQIWTLPTADGSEGDALVTNGSGTLNWASNASEKSWSFDSPSGSSGSFFFGGYYQFAGADNDFNPAITWGTANVSYAAHVLFVAAAGGGGGTDTVVRVSGVSITDTGTRTAADTEDVTMDDAGAAGAYYETSKKWLGQVTIEKQSGPDLLCNYGWAKYWDNNNTDFKVVGVEAVWLAGANDTDIDIQLLHHNATGWTYNVGSSPTFPTPIAALTTDHSTDDQAINGENGAWKRTTLSTNVSGSTSEGTLFCVITTANKAFELGNLMLRVVPQ